MPFVSSPPCRLVLAVAFGAAACAPAPAPADPAPAWPDLEDAAVGDRAPADVRSAPDVRAAEETRVAPTPPEESCPAVPVAAPDSWVTDLDHAPLRSHLTWQGATDTTLTFQWHTAVTDLEAYAPRVWIAPAAEVAADGAMMPLSPCHVVEGYGWHYQETLAGVSADDEVYVTWIVEVTGLTPHTEYSYRVGTWEHLDPETGVFTAPNLSALRTTRTARAKGSRDPFHLVMVGDSRGGSDEIADNMYWLSELEAAAWLFSGDMTNYGTEDEWRDWFDAMAPVLDQTPLMPVQGNHEVFASVYYGLFALPIGDALPVDFKEHAWSIDIGNVHIIGLDGNSVTAIEAQLLWLDGDLTRAVTDPDIDFIIAYLHHPAYSASAHGCTSRVQTLFLPLLEAYNIDLLIAGHDHNYERSHPVRSGAVVDPEDGVVHVVSGGFFAPPYGNGSDWWTVTSTHGSGGNLVHARIDGDAATFTAYNGSGTKVLDEFTLHKKVRHLPMGD